MNAVHLATGTPVDVNPLRNAEYGECLRKNLSNPVVSKMYVLAEEATLPRGDQRVELLKHPKAVLHPLGRRATYGDFMDVLSETEPESLKIIMNADTYFDFTLGNLRGMSLGSAVLFISRVDHVTAKFGFCGSDAWAFQSSPNVSPSFYLGYDCCDFRLFDMIKDAGSEILNPALSVRLWHVHKYRRQRTVRERYDCAGAPERITICCIRNGIIFARETIAYDYPPGLRRKKR